VSTGGDPNRQVIEEFRAKAGVVEEARGGYFAGKPMLLLHTTGARTGAERVNPLLYLEEGERLYVFATKGGAPHDPDWLHNLRANPDVTVEMGAETFPARATVAARAERDRVYAEMSRRHPEFADYERATPRVIPVVRVERAGSR
jgi:deazaflavin-dependent oxidoreductase (nitroreductase family)